MQIKIFRTANRKLKFSKPQIASFYKIRTKALYVERQTSLTTYRKLQWIIWINRMILFNLSIHYLWRILAGIFLASQSNWKKASVWSSAVYWALRIWTWESPAPLSGLQLSAENCDAAYRICNRIDKLGECRGRLDQTGWFTFEILMFYGRLFRIRKLRWKCLIIALDVIIINVLKAQMPCMLCSSHYSDWESAQDQRSSIRIAPVMIDSAWVWSQFCNIDRKTGESLTS